ncbi:MAG: hemolysin III family protein [Oscillospiraceae bacterium]|nr:hemolysin III family protein [Oscillospiraceae bacterium]
MEENKKIKIHYTFAEELLNAISHGVGAVLAILGLVFGVIYTARLSCNKGVVGVSIYGATLILLYTMSTVYHAVKPSRAKAILRIFDHCSIYMLIAGSYTPIIICLYNGLARTIFLSITWGIALFGIALNIINLEKFEKLSLTCYLVMGWQVVFMLKQVLKSVSSKGILLLVAGGLCYSIGAVIYVLGKKYKYMHSVWHIFVLAGSVFHYFSILFYIIK